MPKTLVTPDDIKKKKAKAKVEEVPVKKKKVKVVEEEVETVAATPKAKKAAKKFKPIKLEGKQEAYCPKCRIVVRAKKGTAEIVQTDSGRYRMKANCRECGTSISKFVGDPTK